MGFFTFIFGIDDDIAAGEEADRRNAEISRDLNRKGLITDEDLARSLARLDADGGSAATAAAAAEEQIRGAFGEGLAEGADTIRSGVGSVAGFTLGSVPAWIWLAVALAAAWKLGWLKNLTKG